MLLAVLLFRGRDRMNFLELCQRAARECGITTAGGVPANVTGQTGELRRLVEWVSEAWGDIQRSHPDWRWMRHGFTLETVADDDTYEYSDAEDVETGEAIERFARWWVSDPDVQTKIYLQSAGVGTEGLLSFIPWRDFQWIYKRGTQNSGSPAHITIDPQNRLVLGPKPNGVYVIGGEYQLGPQTLAASTDTPEMPERFHLVVVYRAMRKYGYFESAQEIIGRAIEEGGDLQRQLEVDQLPELCPPPPLA